MVCEPDVALLMMASESFDDEHKLAHKKKIVHKVSKVKTLFFREHHDFGTKN